jgi:hypothetical protein
LRNAGAVTFSKTEPFDRMRQEMEEAVCGFCGNEGEISDDAVQVSCDTCRRPVYWRGCERCGTTHSVSMGKSSWRCVPCKKRNSELLFSHCGSALSLRRRSVVYGPNYTYSAVAFHRSGVRFGAAFDTITFLPWFSVESFSVEGHTEFQRRIIATILARR